MKVLPIICKLVRMSVFGTEEDIPDGINWLEVFALAHANGVGTICYDAVKHLPDFRQQDVAVKHVAQGLEQSCERFRQRCIVTEELGELLGGNKLRLLLLGGDTLADYYPRQELHDNSVVDIIVPFHDRESRRLIVSMGLGVEQELRPRRSVFSFKGVHFCMYSLQGENGRGTHTNNCVVSMLKSSLFSTVEREDGCMELDPVMQAILLVWRASMQVDNGDKVTLQMILDLALLIRKHPYIRLLWNDRLRYAGLNGIAEAMLCASDQMFRTSFCDDWHRSTVRRACRLIRRKL